MPSASEIRQSCLGAWQLLFGRREGLRLLDISADGFWDSFFAMVVSLPPLILRWVLTANELGQAPEIYGGKPSIVARLALSEFAEWTVPLVVLALLAGPLGIGHRFVPFVIASNWATAVLLWLTLPLPLLAAASPADSELILVLALAVFIGTTVLFWRLTNATLDKGAGLATGVTLGIVALTIVLELVLSAALGLYVTEASPA